MKPISSRIFNLMVTMAVGLTAIGGVGSASAWASPQTTQKKTTPVKKATTTDKKGTGTQKASGTKATPAKPATNKKTGTPSKSTPASKGNGSGKGTAGNKANATSKGGASAKTGGAARGTTGTKPATPTKSTTGNKSATTQKRRQATAKPETSADVKKRQEATQQEIRLTEQQIKDNELQVKNGLNELGKLQGDISVSKNKIASTTSQITSINSKITGLEQGITSNEKDLQKLRDEYLKAVKKMRLARKGNSALTFIFASENFNQALRRMRYLKQFSEWKDRQSAAIDHKTEQLKSQREALAKARNEHNEILKRQKTEQTTLEQQFSRQDALVADLKQNGEALKSHLSKKQAEANQLNNRIAQLIAEEQRKAEEARRAAEEKARKEAEAKARREAEERARREAEERARREAEARRAEEQRLAQERAAAEKAAAEKLAAEKAAAEKLAAEKAAAAKLAAEKAAAAKTAAEKAAAKKAAEKAAAEKAAAEKAAAEKAAAEKAANERLLAQQKEAAKAAKKKESSKKKDKNKKSKEEEKNNQSYAEARKRRPKGDKSSVANVENNVAVVTPKASESSAKSSPRTGSDFAAMKGKLPHPVSGTFRVTSRFGRQSLPELPDIVYDNPGIDAEVAAGASAIAIYGGKVSGVYMIPGYNTVVIVNHGSYYTVYGNISSPSVKVGDQVKAGQGLGALAPDEDNHSRSSIHFEVWRNREKLNPLEWIR